MDRIGTFLDTVLRSIVGYPVTLAYILFGPEDVLLDRRDSPPCGPTAALVISVFLALTANSVILAAAYRLPVTIPGDRTMATHLVALAIGLVITGAVARFVFRLRCNEDFIDDVKLLSYPISIALLVTALAMPAMVVFREPTMWLASLLEPATWLASTLIAEVSELHAFVRGVTIVQSLLFVISWGWSLTRILWAGFGLDIEESFLYTLGILFLSMIVVLPLFLLAVQLFRAIGH